MANIKPIMFTRHAKNRMRLRKITESEIGRAISKPDFIESLSEGMYNAWIKVSKKYLRVRYKQEPEKTLVITAVKKRKGWR